MWHFAKGWTVLGYPAIARHELEGALSKHFAQVKPGEIRTLGKGHAHESSGRFERDPRELALRYEYGGYPRATERRSAETRSTLPLSSVVRPLRTGGTHAAGNCSRRTRRP